MASRSDYSALDTPLLLSFIFYPRRDWTPAPAGASDHQVQVEEGVYVSCRLYFASVDGPSILLFHGNGEVACDYDYAAPMFQSLGLNLFVADYRGYGRSGGHPTISNIMSDSHAVFRYFQDLVRSGRYSGGLMVMGRSLGSYPAVELASSNQEYLKGLVIESGFASVGRLLRNLGLPIEVPGLRELEEAHLAKVRSVRVPALVLHGEIDSLVPVPEGEHLYDSLGSADKRLVIIPGAGHNDIMVVGTEQYFGAIREFVSRVAAG